MSHSFIEVETQKANKWVTINVRHIVSFSRLDLNNDEDFVVIHLIDGREIFPKQKYEEFLKFFANVIQESEDGSVKKLKEKPWTWQELPPGCPLYASVEDVKNNTPMRHLKDGDKVASWKWDAGR